MYAIILSDAVCDALPHASGAKEKCVLIVGVINTDNYA